MTVAGTELATLPELDFISPDYAANPFRVLAGWARHWKIARSARGVELLDYDLCRKAILDRRLGTGHPKLMNVPGLPEGRPLDYKRNSISFFNRGALSDEVSKVEANYFAQLSGRRNFAPVGH